MSQYFAQFTCQVRLLSTLNLIKQICLYNHNGNIFYTELFVPSKLLFLLRSVRYSPCLCFNDFRFYSIFQYYSTYNVSMHYDLSYIL
jgi:hypothetical protein